MKKLIIGTILATMFSGVAYSCYKTKQCCKRDYQGNLQCVTKCDYNYCSYPYTIEIR